jgi:hypothetical protein
VKNGYGLKNLTGLFTPDGMTFFDSENNFEFFNNLPHTMALLFVKEHYFKRASHMIAILKQLIF